MHRGRWLCDRRSDSPSCFSSQSAQSDIRPGWDDVEVIFNPDEHISERVIFPITESQSNGIEDARFVEFDEGGRRTFYATYTAYSGKAIRSELIETTDFISFRMSPLRDPPRGTRAWHCFPEGSTASTP